MFLPEKVSSNSNVEDDPTPSSIIVDDVIVPETVPVGGSSSNFYSSSVNENKDSLQGESNASKKRQNQERLDYNI
eukprot:13907104-Ditylum_brightwellii.AAC.1